MECEEGGIIIREIKFRVFDKNIPANSTDKELDNPTGAMVENWDYIINSAYLVDGFRGKYPIMQFTGLKDRNGTEIYEDDILLVPYNRFGNIIVSFKEGKFNIAEYNLKSCEVVGNIYQNPELKGKYASKKRYNEIKSKDSQSI